MYHFVEYSKLFSACEIIDYLRKSQSDDPLLSVEEVLARHEAILDEWDERHLGEAVPPENRFREVVSGETISERPEINKVLRLIESPKYKAIKVVDPQRLTRGDLEDIGRLMKILKFTKTYIITPERVYDLNDEYDWSAFEAELKRGNDYLNYTKKILNRGRILSVSQGNFLGSIPPYGYNKVWRTDGKKKYPTLEINEEQADIVRMIFDCYANKDMGANSICLQLDELNVPPPNGEYWSPASMKRMLMNIHYTGKVCWNHRKTIDVVEDGKIYKTRPTAKEGEYLIFEGKHEAIISDELFQAAQEARGRKHRAKPDTKVRNPLAGLVQCRCGRAMSLRFYKKTDGTTRCSPRLICDNQIKCHTGSCLYEDALSEVKSVLAQKIADFELLLKSENKNDAALHESIIKSLEKKLDALEKKEVLQWEMQSDPDESKRMPPQVFQQLNAKLLKEKEKLQKSLEKAYSEKPKVIDYEEKLHRFQEALDALNNDAVSAEKQNLLLKNCIERIEYSREAPERLKKKPNEKKGERFKTSGAYWSDPPASFIFELKI